MPADVTITISAYSPHPGSDFTGTAHSAWMPVIYLDCYAYTAEVTSASIDDYGTIGGTTVNEGFHGYSASEPYSSITVITAPLACLVDVEISGGMFRFVVPYSVTNHPLPNPDWANPSIIDAVVLVKWV